LSCR